MIESGSHTPGISATDFNLLPPNTALRYEQPAPSLRDYLSDYHVLDSEDSAWPNSVQQMLPSWPAIRIILGPPFGVTIGGKRTDPVPVATLFGTSSRSIEVNTRGGVSIGINITPLGWSRLFDVPANRFRDRVTLLEDMMPPMVVTALVDRLRASDQGPAVKGILDDFFLSRIGPVNPDEPAIRALLALLTDEKTRDLAEAGAHIGIPPHTLRRLSARYFGFPPKMLLVRARWLRAFMLMVAQGEPADYSRIGTTYYDVPHFLRDSKRFLGMTPRRFIAISNHYLIGVMDARTKVLGAATAALQRIDT